MFGNLGRQECLQSMLRDRKTVGMSQELEQQELECALELLVVNREYSGWFPRRDLKGQIHHVVDDQTHFSPHVADQTHPFPLEHLSLANLPLSVLRLSQIHHVY